MANVLIVAYLLIVLALVAVILLQRSEGGGLGMGGGGANGFMSVRGTANVLTRATGILATLFFASAIGLTLLSGADKSTENIVNGAATTPVAVPAAANKLVPGTTAPVGKAAPSILDQLNAAQTARDQQSGATPAPAAAVPATTAPATTAPTSQDAPDLALPSGGKTPAAAPAASPAPAASTTAPATSSSAAPATTAPAATTTTAPSTATTPAAAAPAASSTPPAATGTSAPATPATN